MLTGQQPFQGDNLLVIAEAIKSGVAPALVGHGPSISGVLARALRKGSRQRYAAVADLLRELQEARPQHSPSVSGESGLPSIAVLPFVNMSPDPDNEFFSDGLSEELLNSLGRLPGLKVAARTSSFAFKNETLDLRDVAERLGVDTVLEGSVRRHAQRVRITAQLINATDGHHSWSESYERELDDVCAIQTDIASRVADALSVTLLESDASRLETPDTRNTEAYDAYLQGLQLMASFHVNSVLKGGRLVPTGDRVGPAFREGVRRHRQRLLVCVHHLGDQLR